MSWYCVALVPNIISKLAQVLLPQFQLPIGLGNLLVAIKTTWII